MQRFGIPTIFADQWIEFLNTMKRILFLKGTISEPHASACGVPEGDPMSVVLSVMISMLVFYFVRTNMAVPFAYVDNFE